MYAFRRDELKPETRLEVVDADGRIDVTPNEITSCLTGEGCRWGFIDLSILEPMALGWYRPEAIFLAVYHVDYPDGFDVWVLLGDMPDQHLTPVVLQAIGKAEVQVLEQNSGTGPEDGPISSWLGLG